MPQKIKNIAAYVLDKFSAGDIQSGIYMPREEFIRDKQGHRYRTKLRKIKGTGIPAGTISRMQLPPDHPKYSKPGKETIKKLKKFYSRFAYNAVRSQGASAKDAAKYSKAPVLTLDKHLETFRNIAKTISQNKNVPLQYIIAGMNESHKHNSTEDWDKYLTEKRFHTIDISSRKKTQSEVANFAEKISEASKQTRRKPGRKAKRKKRK